MLNPRKNVKDGRKELNSDGTETGKIWSNKFNDYIFPNLEQVHEDFRQQAEKNIRICYNGGALLWRAGGPRRDES